MAKTRQKNEIFDGPGGNEVRFQNKGLEPIDLESGKWSLKWDFEGFSSCSAPLPEPLITAPHQLFHKMWTANLLPLVFLCKVCGPLFSKDGSPTLKLESFHWSK
jgi:hypothetical protein